uniref:Putative ovule protein n=1 Tax=Solanum chacoense TaxID=4108 RepID=A0A0V0HM78_SOLCH
MSRNSLYLLVLLQLIAPVNLEESQFFLVCLYHSGQLQLRLNLKLVKIKGYQLILVLSSIRNLPFSHLLLLYRMRLTCFKKRMKVYWKSFDLQKSVAKKLRQGLDSLNSRLLVLGKVCQWRLVL